MPESSSEVIRRITGRSVAWNSAWTLVADGTPFLVAIYSVPRLLHALGTERFGVLTVIWAVVGYFSLFDLGVGRALTNMISQCLGRGDEESVGPLAWTALTLVFGFGICSAVAVAVVSPYLVTSILKIPAELRAESIRAFYVFTISVPFVITTIALRGILEAHHCFGIANAIRWPTSVFTYAAPLAVLPFSTTVPAIVAVLVLGRVIALVLHASACLAMFPDLRSIRQWHAGRAGPLLKFGGWMTISNLLIPIMTGVDRVIVGSVISIAAVAFYGTAYEIISKLGIVPNALMSVLFPTFSAVLVSDPARARRLYHRALWRLVLIMGVISSAVIAIGPLLLSKWLGADFAVHSGPVLRILGLGLLFNAISYLPFAMVQGAGRSDWTGKLHLAGLPVYIAAFWFGTSRYGIVGSALVWVAWMIVEMVLLMWLAAKVLRPKLVTVRPAEADFVAFH